MLEGIDARLVEVEVELAQGLPMLTVIGLGDAAIQESKFRVQSALRGAGLELPHKRVTVNLAPADLRKDGSLLDLPVAVGMLSGAGRLAHAELASMLIVGELALDGHLRPIRGALSIARLAHRRGFSTLLLPKDSAPEAALMEQVQVLGARHLAEVLAHLSGVAPIPREPPPPLERAPNSPLDLADVAGQGLAKRALELAAAGLHNLLLIGPPGSGKTMLARRLPGILPPLARTEVIDVLEVHSAAGLLRPGAPLSVIPPFRAPHHTLSTAALTGGGVPVRPGELSLAHRGVLFLDEAPELSRAALEALRQPLEERELVVSRVRGSLRLPADFVLVAAANPCPCGFATAEDGRCRCRPEEVARYLGRISGPLLDRIDLVVETQPVAAQVVTAPRNGARESETIKARINAVRDRARSRGVRANALLAGQALYSACGLDQEGRQVLDRASRRLGITARGIERVLRVARTIADLEARETVMASAVLEAIRFRPPPWMGERGAPQTHTQ